MSKARVLVEFLQLLRHERKYWLGPVVLLFLLFGLVLVFSESSPLAPLIYAVF
jgi:hypothetical protein